MYEFSMKTQKEKAEKACPILMNSGRIRDLRYCEKNSPNY